MQNREQLSSLEAPIGVAGAGRMGAALGRLLRESGRPVVAVASRTTQRAEAAAAFIGSNVKAVSYDQLPRLAARVLITVPDDAVAEVAATLAGAGMNRGAALHTCGALGPEALEALADAGVSCGVLHPLQTVATPEQGLSALRGIAFAIAGDGSALEWAKEIVKILDGQTLRISSEHRSLYHAAAVMASNYVVGLVDAAVRLMEEAGVDSNQALHAVAPVVEASTCNAVSLGPAEALTGPIERGDAATVRCHLKALEKGPQPIARLYRAAGLQVLDLARRKGLAGAAAGELEKMLREGEEPNA